MEQDCKRYEILPMTSSKTWYIEDLVENLRQQDIDEMSKLGIEDFFREILDSVAASKESYVAINQNGKVIVMYGVIDHGEDAQIWCIGSKFFSEYKKSFVAGCMAVIRKWLGMYKMLWNYVSKENGLSIRWLDIVFGARFTMGFEKNGNRFYRFEIGGKKDV